MSVRTSVARRTRARERVREDILLAAAGVFARRGYAGATLAELAEAAGYAAPSLYRYFSSKEEIFRRLVEFLAAEVSATFEVPVDRTVPLAARLERLLEAQERLARGRRPIWDLLASAHVGDAPVSLGGRSIRDPRAGLAFYQRRLHAWLRRHASPRELRCPARVAARAIAGIAFAFHAAPSGPAPDPSAHARAITDLALHGVLP
jgi:AcrR family transcriptional regulator